MDAPSVRTVLGFAVVALLTARGMSAPPPVEGEAELLAVIRDRQAGSRDALRRGRIIGEIRVGWAKPESTERKGEGSPVEVVWDGPNLRAELRGQYQATLSHGPTKTQTFLLETPGEAANLVISSGFSSNKTDPNDPSKPARKTWSELTRYPPGGQVRNGRFATFRVDGVPRPRQDWFGLEGQLPWEVFIDPTRARTVRRYVVRRAGDDVFVERHQNNGAIFLAAFSLAKGGNIVSYEYVAGPRSEIDREKHRDRRGRFEWERTDGGVWWVRSFRIESADPGKPALYYEFTATAFDPEPSIPFGFFTEAGLPIPGGTQLQIENVEGSTIGSLDPAPPSPGVELPPLGGATVREEGQDGAGPAEEP